MTPKAHSGPGGAPNGLAVLGYHARPLGANAVAAPTATAAAMTRITAPRCHRVVSRPSGKHRPASVRQASTIGVLRDETTQAVWRTGSEAGRNAWCAWPTSSATGR